VIGQDAYMQREKSTINFAAEAAADVMRVINRGKFFQCSEKAIRSWWYQPQPSAFAAPVAISRLKQRPPTSGLCYGAAEVSPTADPKLTERIETKHHDHPILIHNDSAMPMMAPASVINHTDAELILLENLVGRWPPFYGKTYYGY
jgi:hypothetical protein